MKCCKNEGNTQKNLQKENQNSFMPALHITAKSTISFLIPSHCRLLLSGFENQIFVRFLARGELVQNAYKRDGGKMEKKKVGH